MARCLVICGAVGVLLLSGCSKHSSSAKDAYLSAKDLSSASPAHQKRYSAAQNHQVVTEDNADERQDPCSLLDPTEVSAVLGALATPPYRGQGGSASPDGTNCIYEDAQFHTVDLEVDWEGASTAWKLLGNVQAMVNGGPTKGMLHLAEGSDIAGAWDEARVVGCCTFSTLMGDQGVTIDFGSSNLTVAQAAKLADAALSRLSKPLSIDGNANVAAAQAYNQAHRPTARPPCSLISRADAEAIIGPLASDPEPKGSSGCDYHAKSEGTAGPPEIYSLSVAWRGGFAEFHEKAAVARGAAQGLSNGIAPLQQAIAGSDAPPGSGPWEAAHSTFNGLQAVKNDELLTIDFLAMGNPGMRDKALRLLQKAASAL